MGDLAWSGFVVRPFGKRTVQPKSGPAYEVDFEQVQRALIDPAMAAAGIAGSTTEKIFEAGNIREDMFQLLAHADIVIADISLHNANVFYELGARHALRPKRTFLIRYAGDEVPFDIKTDRYLSYERDDPGAALAALVRGLQATLADREGVDSPIFKLLPALKAPSVRDLVPVPQDFREELRWAQENRRTGHLALLAEEVQARPWGAEGLRGVAAALAGLKAFAAARDAWEAVRTRLDRDLEADLKLATLHQKMQDLAASDSAIERALTLHGDIPPARRAEALSLRGSNAKERWMAGWGEQPPAALAEVALHSEHLRQAGEAYAAGFAADLNHHYSGINALAMTRVRLALAQARPDAWEAAFDSDTEAQRALDKLQEQVQDLQGAVQLSLQRGAAAEAPGSEDLRWVHCSMADALLLRQEKPPRVLAGYRRALDGAPPFFFDVVRRQLAMYRRLGLFADTLAALAPLLDGLESSARASAAAVAGTAAPAPAAVAPDRVLLFTGHRIDEPGRPAPRFPAGQEPVARQALRDQLAALRAAWGPDARVLGLAGGANGGDLLFHEVCAEQGIPTELYLLMPDAPFIAASVRADPAVDSVPGWIERFHQAQARCAAAGALHRLSSRNEQPAELPAWLGRPAGYNVWERNNRWMLQSALALGPRKLTLLALWDGQGGDAPGGTQHMVDAARAAGAAVRIIDTRALFGLSGAG